MTATFESLKTTLQGRRLLWVGFPTQPPPLHLVSGCALPELYFSKDQPNTFYLAFDSERGYARDLESSLSALIGPYDVIVLSTAFLDGRGYALRSIKTALLRLCHSKSVVLAEGGTTSFSRQQVEKILVELGIIIARSMPGLPVGKTRLTALSSGSQDRPADPRSNIDDRLRERWSGHTGEHHFEQTRFIHAQKRIAVLGGGIAGVTIALECLRRGHQVDLFEAEANLLSQGSNQPMLATFPNFSRDGNNLGLLTQYGLSLLADSPYKDLLINSGRFQTAGGPDEAAEQRTLVDRLRLAPELLQFLDLTQSSSLWGKLEAAAGLEPLLANTCDQCQWGGLWISLAAQLDVNQLRQYVTRLASQDANRLTLHLGEKTDPKQLQRKFEVVILAGGEGTPELLTTTQSDQELLAKASWKVYGGSSFSVGSPDLQTRLPGAASATEKEAHRPASLPIFGGPVSLQSTSTNQWLIGSTYFEKNQPSASHVQPSEDEQWQAIIQGARRLTGNELGSFTKVQMHSGSRCSVRDRMPLIGPINPAPNQEKTPIYLATAFGSRGLLWAHLAAQLISDHIEGISPRLGLKALKSIDPLRYVERPKSAYES